MNNDRLYEFKEYIKNGIDYLENLDTKEITIKNSYLEDKLSHYKRMLKHIQDFENGMIK